MYFTTRLTDRTGGPGLRLLALCLAALTGGCGSGQSPHPVEPELARTTLREVLESWKNGDTIDAWRTDHPEVVVQDLDWMAGRRLEDFEILGEGEAVDANLLCQVRLTLDDADAEPEEQTVTYQVTTSPKRTVFRQMMP
jgi:hypothetical protein